MISNRCARKSLVTNCNSIISKNYLRLLVDSNDEKHKLNLQILPSQHFVGFQRFDKMVKLAFGNSMVVCQSLKIHP